MQESFNPYESGQSHLAGADGVGDAIEGVPLSEVTKRTLFSTRVWVVMVLIGLVLNLGFDVFEVFVSASGRGGSFVIGDWVNLFLSLVVGVVMVIFVTRYCLALGRFKECVTEESFERVAVTQSKVWKMFGVFCVFAIVFVLVAIIIGAVATSRF